MERGDLIRKWLREAGAAACGFAEASEVDPAAKSLHDEWIKAGRHGGMDYLGRYSDVRSDPRLLLEGAATVIAAAFNYNTTENSGEGGLLWARYALGDDYHEEIRRRLTAVADRITEEIGAKCRVCVDTAPLRERYWAVRSGLGFVGLNNLLIIPGIGSYCLLGFIITTLPLQPGSPSTADCGRCERCIESCPGHALDGHGGMDARLCRSYLTIESRDCDLPALADRVYGCDICQEVCPWNQGAPLSSIPEFAPRPAILALRKDDILEMAQEEFSSIFRHSAIKRAKLAGLRRNALHLGPEVSDPGDGSDLPDRKG
ncbi:MAG: tRNA epoxyqueuosine(34) reductase QueG [Muribaculaceae bacterium]|nr:tRNA epoxyqueuosine(34) reductase QueG [Muribaculaceae bacterium]